MLAAHVPGDATSDIAVAAKRFGRRKNERAPINVRFWRWRTVQSLVLINPFPEFSDSCSFVPIRGSTALVKAVASLTRLRIETIQRHATLLVVFRWHRVGHGR